MLNIDGIKKRFNNSFWAVFVFSFSMVVFSVIDLYNSNKSEFFFSFTDIFTPVILFFIVFFLILLCIAFLIPKKIYKYYLALLYVLTICFYIQGNFLRTNFGVLNGTEINWSLYSFSSVLSVIFWCFSACAVFYFIRKSPRKTIMLLKYASFAVLLIQVITLVFSINTKSEDYPKKAYLSNQNEYSVSSNKNTIVFILDCFDSSTMKDIINKTDYDEESKFEDFTYYDNVAAGATRTKYAIPYIFTGVTNKEPVSYTKYLKNQFEKSVFIKTLKELNCDSSVFTVSNYIDTSLNDVFNNLVSEKKKVSSRFGLTSHFYKLVLYRYVPTPLKRCFWMYSGDFDRWIANDIEDKTPYVIDDVKFYAHLKKTGLKANDKDNSFRFFHLFGPHSPFTMTEKGERVKVGESTLIRQAMGSLNIVSAYLEELKRLNLYDNATIIVMADHGALDKEQNPVFLLKESNKRKAFSIDSMSLSYKNVPDMLVSAVKGENLNISQYDCKDNVRYFYQQKDENNITRLIEYVINGDVSNRKNIKETGVVYYGDSNNDTNGDVNNYKLGTTLFFTSEATGNKYARKGFYKNEGSHTWTGGKESELLFVVKEKCKDLFLNLDYSMANGTQNVDLYVNDKYVLSWTAKGEEKKTLMIPRDFVGNNGIIKVVFKFPNACSPYELGTGTDRRLLALAFFSLRLSTGDLEKVLLSESEVYTLGTKLDFSEKGDLVKRYIVDGFSYAESWGTWSLGKMSRMRFVLKKPFKNLLLNFDCNVYGKTQPITLYANGVEICKFEKGGNHSVFIPKECISKNGILTLSFLAPNASSPAENGQSSDKRVLAIGFRTMQISELNIKNSDLLLQGSAFLKASDTEAEKKESGSQTDGALNKGENLTSNKVILFLSRIFSYLYSASGRNYLLALLLFTLLTKIVLLPVGVWSQKNSNKLASLQADINNLKASAYGNRDYIADETAALYKKAHYNPFLSTVPMLIQIAMLLLVINVVKRPDLAGLSAADMRFWRIDLTKYPYQANIKYLVMPLLAGLSAFALGAFQNKFNPLQSVQSKSSQKSTNAVSIGISLILGAFVAVAVGFYWVFSNLLTIFQQLLLNVLVPPKGVDKKAVSESRERLEKVESLKKKNKLTPEQKAKEKADYKRFFRVANKHIVFYSESNGFYKYMEGLIEWLLVHTNLTIHYVTSDSNDSIFKRAAENPRIRAYFIGPVKLITLFMKMDAEMVVMTMTDLGNYHLKRSYVKKDVEYVYIPHYPLSTHLIFHTGSFDNYDTIFCVGDFQKAEIREYESLHNLKEKNLVSTGYYQLEKLHESYKRSLESGAGANAADRKRKILVAPSWQAGNILDSCIDDILASLLGKGYQVIVRPHPEYVKRYGERLQSLIDRYSDYKGGDLIFETDFTSNESIFTSDILISDWSGIAYEYAFVTGRPPVFVNTPMKVNNPAYKELTAVPKEISLRGEVGRSVEPANVSGIDGIVAELLENEDEFIENNLKIRDTLVANFGHSSEASGRYIIGSLKKKKEKKAENSV